MIAAQNQLGGRRVEEVVIFGDGQHHSTLKQLLEKELSLPVKLVDPFEQVEWADGAGRRKPEFPGTFAPLLGMLLDEAAGRGRRPSTSCIRASRPPPPNQPPDASSLPAAWPRALLLGLLDAVATLVARRPDSAR